MKTLLSLVRLNPQWEEILQTNNKEITVRENSEASTQNNKNGGISIKMENCYDEYFLIYAEYLIELWNRSGEVITIKKEDTNIYKNAKHHLGRVDGLLDEISINNKVQNGAIQLICITLYFGFAGKNMIYKDEYVDPLNCEKVETYMFRRDHLERIVGEI